MEKRPCTNVCGVLVSFHEVMKLQSFFWKWHHTHEYTTHFTTGFLCIFLLILWRRNLHQSLMVFLTIFHKFMKLQNFKWWNYVLPYLTSSTQMNIHNMLTMAYMLILRIKLWPNSWSIAFCIMMKKDRFKEKLLLCPHVLFNRV